MKPWHTHPRRQTLHIRSERHLALAKMRQHFITRCNERAPGINPLDLWNELVVAISHRLGEVEKVARVPRGRECWRFVAKGRTLYTIFDPRFLCPVTVMTPGQWIVKRGGKRRRLAA